MTNFVLWVVIALTSNLKLSRRRRRRLVNHEVKKLHVLQLKSIFLHAASFSSDT